MRYPLVLVLFLSLIWPLPGFAQSDLDTTIESVRTSIEHLAESALPEAEKKELQELYQSTLGFLQRSKTSDENLAALRQELDQAPTVISDLRRQSEQLKVTDSDQLRQRYTNQNLESLEELLGNKVGHMFAWQNELTSVNSDLIAAQTRPERTQSSISSNQTREQAINEQLRLLQRQPDSAVKSARQSMLRAELQSLQRANDLLRQRLLGNSVLQDIATQKRDLLSRQISEIETDLQILQDVIDDKRRTQSEQAVSDVASQVLEGSEHRVLREQAGLNRQLSEELLRITNQMSDLTRKNILTQQQIDSLTQIDQALEQQISVLEGSLVLSRILQQQKRNLPQVRVDSSVTELIAELRLRQFELTQLRDELATPSAYLERVLQRLPESLREELRPDLEQVVNSRPTLVEQLITNSNNLLSLAITLQLNQRQLQQLSGDLRRTIDDQLFWVPSNRPIDKSWLTALPGRIGQQWTELALLQQSSLLIKALRDNLLGVGLLIVGLGLYFWRRPLLRRTLRSVHDDIGHFRRDSSRHTPKAILLTALLVTPVPFVLAGLGLILKLSETDDLTALSAALLQAALAWFVLHLLYRVFDAQGIAERHFRWDTTLVQRLHRLTRDVAWVALPLVVVIALAEVLPEHLNDDVLGRLIMFFGLLGLGVLLVRLMWRTEPLYSSRLVHHSATLVLGLTPLILAGMTAWGYHYTSIRLADRFIDTLYLIVAWMLVEGTVVRNLNVAGRRLAYQRALSKRQAAQQQAKESSEDSEIVAVEIPEMDLQQINQQSLRLAKLGLLLLFGVLVYLTWSDLVSAASYLESIALWEYNSGTADNPMIVPMSAADVLGALVIVVLTITLARNLPGLLEILVLSRMELRQGSSYAITTLLSYTIISIGIISGLSALGVSWDKLQWLVAALGVGLGFGLQEIFANFISGLIILFERPVRIGDVVTIGTLSGTVNRIRIRATTITDFDRKEIIVPNKTFVTSQLINWSLNDTVTRVTVKLGAAYGSDLALIKQLLLQIADNNSRVLKDPAPVVLFLNFGDSTLDHELRIHVKELGDRNPAIDEINREIDRLFRENNIEIAFRQVDVNLRTSEGLEKLIESRKG
ncbi:mechanosensitive channel MscK [Pseudomonas jilinensis]|uniref:Mechanosensitive channel MscK n=1 Tax=Pseudomonas jilinensis TaxID=2078689 RepID=A0A396RSH2_9PSED|nr:mechanosensitive channel MscK [Pseudomonas jilinensis]RHW19597.1 mechanosensitive channel MscK [Pseudomonas jilinensis]